MLEALKILVNRINDFQIYSDVYKEVYGFRPQGRCLDTYSTECQYGGHSWKFIQQENLRQVMEESKAETAAINACMAAGAPDIDTACRWLEDADEYAMWA